MSPVELTLICERAAAARTREIVAFIRTLAPNEGDGEYIHAVAEDVVDEFLGDVIDRGRP